MQAVTITQISPNELKELIQRSIIEVLDIQQKKPPADKVNEEDEILTVKDAAVFLSLKVSTIYALIAKEELPVMKRSKRCYFIKADLINYLKEGRQKSTAEIVEAAEMHLKVLSKKKSITT